MGWNGITAGAGPDDRLRHGRHAGPNQADRINAAEVIQAMNADDATRERRTRVPAWIYWGATGVLQPLSEEFLYRSPSDAMRRRGSRVLDVSQGERHARG